MNVVEKLRTAEHQGREAARQGFLRAWTGVEEAQSRIRRKMRIYPRSAKPSLPLSLNHEGLAPASGPIVSINGKDVPAEEAKTSQEQIA